MAPPFRYEPLQGNQIRLLDLLPGSYHDDIHIHITHVALTAPTPGRKDLRLSKVVLQKTLPAGYRVFKTPEDRFFFVKLDDPQNPIYEHPCPEFPRESYVESRKQICFRPEFEALSYAWGPLERNKSVFVVPTKSLTSLSSVRILKIGSNLDEALRNLRQPKTSRRLWIDAICLDQDDRAAQIQRMGLIYSLAARVVVWLGPRTEDSELALRTLDHIGRQVEIASEVWIFGAPNAVQKDWWRINLEAKVTNNQSVALHNLVARAWFSRIWVLQEIILANSNAIMQSGADIIPFYYFRRGIAVFYDRFGICPGFNNRLKQLGQMCYGISGSTSMAQVIESARTRECSDPRDKIYGILSFVGKLVTQGIQPSYKTSVGEVYKTAFLNYCRKLGRLDPLSGCSLQIKRSDAPSWVPNWEVPHERRLACRPGSLATGVSRAIFRHLDGDVLEVLGVACGKIVDCIPSSHHPGAMQVPSIVRRLKEFQHLHSSPQAHDHDEEDIDEISLLLSSGQVQERTVGTRYPSLADWRKFLQKTAELGHPGDAFSDTDERRYVQPIIDVASRHDFVRLDSGHLGAGCGNTGDEIYCLFGHWAPVVLRPTGENTHQVVGDCHIPYLMDGETVLGPLPRPWRIEHHSVDGGFRPKYINTDTGKAQNEDPRLCRLPEEWEQVEHDRTADDPVFVEMFRNRETGVIQNSDPRLSPDFLMAQGLDVKEVRLI